MVSISLSARDPSASASSSLPPSTASPAQTPAEKRKLQGWKHSAAGSLGGMTGAIVTSPFDVVKTRLQSDLFRHTELPLPSKAIAGSSSTATASIIPPRPGVGGTLWQFVDTVYLIRRIAVEEGWRALYKGLGPSLVGIIPARAINFYFYPTSKAFLARQFPNAPRESADQTAEDSPLVHLGAAVIAGIMTATGTNPIWVIKTRLQLEASKRERPPSTAISAPPKSAGSPLPRIISTSAAALPGSATATMTTAASTSTATAAAPAAKPSITPAFTMTMDIIRKDGMRGLYRGLSASYLGVSEGVIQWVLYERFKRLTQTHASLSPDSPKLSPLSYITGIIGASGGAKAVASLITYPHEVIRTRLRQPAINNVIRYKGLMQTLRLVVAEEGVASLYGGLTAHLFRVVPNAACMFLIYEVVAERLR